MKKLASLCILAACLVTGLLAQDVSGTIGGTVLDPTGSAVPKAKVTITNTDRSQVVRTLTTDATGTFSAPLIPIGNYTIKIEAPGFKANQINGIVLNVNDDLKFNPKLEVGAVTETVDVTESAVQVELSSPAAATTIEGTQIRELTLGTRNYEQLMVLLPGVVSNATDDLYIGNSLPSGSASTIPYSVNGMRNSANNWTVDGADNVDRGSNLTLSTFPSVDAISQFKVERSLYTADTGRAGGAQINVVTKSGTSQFHGGVYEFFRNDALNANIWSNNANKVNLSDSANPQNNCSTNFTSTCYAKRPAYRWNDFGYTIGGPIYFGKYNKDHNKTFFFFSQEWHYINNYTTFNPVVPTTGMLAGNMIQPVCITVIANGAISCPAGAAPVTQIPANLINANSAAYIKDIFGKLPLLNGTTTAATTSLFAPVKNIFNARQEIGRIDHSFSEKFQLWGRFTVDDIPTTEAGGLFGQSSVPGMAITQTNSPGRGVAIHGVNLIGTKIVSDASFNFSQSAIITVPVGLTAKANSPDINPKEPFANPEGVVPSVTISSGSSANGAGPYSDYNRNYAVRENLTWIKGRHTLGFGYTFDRYQKTENANSGQGSFAFSTQGLVTGTTSFQQSWANFLLGNVSTFTQPSQDITPNVWAWQHEAWVQDDFKVTPRLTLNMGVRWSFFGQPTDKNGEMTNFDPFLYSSAAAPKIDPTTGNVIPGTANWQTNGIIIGGKNSPFGSKIANDSYKNFAPRLGLAWDPFGDAKTSVRAGYGIYYDSGLFGTYEQNIFTNPPFVASVNYANASFNDVSGGTAGISPLSPQATSVLALDATQLPARVPYSQQWSLNIQRRIAGAVLEVGYFGSKGTHLLGVFDQNEAMPGAALAAGLHSTTGTGTNAPGTTAITASEENRINYVKPFQGFNGIRGLATAFDSNYHSLQVTLRKNFGAAGLFGIVYSWSKTLTDNASDRSNAPQNSYNWHEGEYQLASWNRLHVLTANYVYTVPFFKHGRGFMHNTVGGWELSGIISTYTGQPISITGTGLNSALASVGNVDPAGLGIVGVASSPASARPDVVCDPTANAARTYATGLAASVVNGGPSWFNIACYQAVPNGAVRPGNASRYAVIGPGYFNWDASLLKNFNISKDGRWNAQLGAEASNAMNWVNPSTVVGTTASTTFGQVSGFRAARRMTLRLKINF
ncbi:MAG TPA: TonB-dependent receptor [Candidatus Sulfopaludibacter sp.]|jgi:hypothetical protein|nr:TonB-dependent receptor [Candidatus Sulfopaludibacter sp.]